MGEDVGLREQVHQPFQHTLAAAHRHQPVMDDGDPWFGIARARHVIVADAERYGLKRIHA